MANGLKLYVFGDQTFDVQPRLKQLLGHRDNPVLQDFLGKAYDAIRVQLYTLSQETRESLPRFTSIEDLLLWENDGGPCLPLDMALTSLYQLATFISEADNWSVWSDTSRVTGLCTGTLAAAAVACSRNVLELVPLAVDAVNAAFRVGKVVSGAVKRIVPSHGSGQSWSLIVPDHDADDLVRSFSETSNLPSSSRPYTSAFAPNFITVSGPPATLSRLIETKGFDFKRIKSIPIYGPYHAPHIHSKYEVSEILGHLPSRLANARACVPIISSGIQAKANQDFATLLGHAIEQILLEPIQWTNILAEIQAWIHQSKPISFSVVPIASTANTLIYAELKHTAIKSTLPTSHGLSKLLRTQVSKSSHSQQPNLAIIGMSGRFPGAKDTDAFWDLLYQGLDVHKPAPALHWDVRTHVDPTGTTKNTSQTPYGCWLDDPGEFDARFFNISPREAPQIDPAQRLALMTAYEAIEQAGLVPDATPSTRRDRVGVFYGVTSNDWMETNSAQDIDTYFIPGGNRAFIPGRINYCFKFSGPSYAVDTACSSSLAGIHIACNALWQGDVDTAIAGGTNVLTNPDFTAGLDRGHFLSRTGNCRTFDDTADGYCRGEGIGTIILKRLSDALADKDPILGVVLGASTNHSAESESITRPHVGAQKDIFHKILNSGGVDPYSVSYVEMHGTGTQAGDAGEMSSVLDTFAPALSRIEKGRKPDQQLYLGSAKANIGHGEAASGVSSLIKVLLMMQKETIVPHCGIKTKINHKFPTDLQDRKVNIALTPVPWTKDVAQQRPRRAFVNNFSAAGGNSALLIEDAPPIQEPKGPEDTRSRQLIAFSAKNAKSLQGNLSSMLKFVEGYPDVPLNQLSYTTTARRTHHPHRVMLSAPTVENLCAQIKAAIRDNKGATRPKSAPKMVFAFTGQGALYPGMGKQYFEVFSIFRMELYRLNHIAQNLGFESVLPVIHSTDRDFASFTPMAVHLASICIQIATFKLLSSWNLRPTAVVGHSLGEYAALNVAGVLSDIDTLYLVGKRATLLQEKCSKDSHAMLVVKGAVSKIKEVLHNIDHQVACINSPIETVLAGSNEEISDLKAILTDAGLDSTVLKIPYAFHSSQMDAVTADLEKVASPITFHKPHIPVLCPLDGGVIRDIGKFDGHYLARHCREPVNILQALLDARHEVVYTDQTTLLEIGPHPAVASMVKATLGPQMITLPTAQRGVDMWQTLSSTLSFLYMAGADIRWAAYQHDFGASHKVLSLPAYSWDTKHYWIQYVNDWSIRKGDPPLVVSNTPKLESTTIHRVVEESGDSNAGHVIVEADITRDDLSPLVQGHEVDGIPLCTPSVYADVALTLGDYLLQRYRPNQVENLVDVSDMTISKALILKAGVDQQLLQVHTKVDWKTQEALTTFMSFDSKQALQEHARCVIRFKVPDLREKLQADVSNVQRKIEALRTGVSLGTTARYNRPMVYRAIRPLARFHDDYRAIDEIILNSNTLEATTRLSFGSVKRAGVFHTHPAIIDSLTQSCGFTMNCNDFSDLDLEVFMNHGWNSFQIFEPLDFDKVYTTYSSMQQGPDKLWHGDVVVLDGTTVVAFFGQIAIQGVPRRVLKVILSIESGIKSQKSQPVQSKQAHPLTHTPSTPPPSTVATEGRSSKYIRALAIIADECGLALSDLADDTAFADVGVDSLLGMTISARFGEELDIDLDFNALFFEYPTAADLKVLFGSSGASMNGASTPQGDSSVPSTATATGNTTPDTNGQSLSSQHDLDLALQIVSEESGLAVEDLTDDMSFADAGVDSLLSLVVVSRLRDEIQLDIEHGTIFLDCPTVADFKHLLAARWDTESTKLDQTLSSSRGGSAVAPIATSQTQDMAHKGHEEASSLDARRTAVAQLVSMYTTGYACPVPLPTSTVPDPNRKVVLVTGGTGSLGSHLVYHFAQLPDVETVVCLNREHKAEPYDRQYKAMRGKGIRFPEHLKPKLLVLQADSSKPMLGLEKEQYDFLLSSVTHLIHNAWPMSAKRLLSGFESQFSIVRNLIEFASGVAARRPEAFKFSFQLVSSIGVVGRYGLGIDADVTEVPEARVDINSVLPNGYSEAKWGCEKMLDQTLHKYPARFRTMAVRLGQIAGSKTSGYWNPMEHFGFLVKSSQTLGALPDVSGKAYWTPVNDVAATLSDLVLAEQTPHAFYHIDNPVGQPWVELNRILAGALDIHDLIPFEDWVNRVRTTPQHSNPASTLLEFLDSNYLRMSCGGLVLDVTHTLEHSASLAAVKEVREDLVRKYIHVWKEIGFLS